MKNYKIWVTVKIYNAPKKAKILTSTWVVKKKSNGNFRARINGCVYEQVDGIHFNGSSIHFQLQVM